VAAGQVRDRVRDAGDRALGGRSVGPLVGAHVERVGAAVGPVARRAGEEGGDEEHRGAAAGGEGGGAQRDHGRLSSPPLRSGTRGRVLGRSSYWARYWAVSAC